MCILFEFVYRTIDYPVTQLATNPRVKKIQLAIRNSLCT